MRLAPHLTRLRGTVARFQSSSTSRLDDSADAAAFKGWVIVAVFFGLLGTWSAVAPLNGAVVAQAVIKIDGNRKSIQHLEGGIVKKLHVHDSDMVNAGDTLIELDATQALAEFEIYDQLCTVLWLSEARLQAEQADRPSMAMPSQLRTRMHEPNVEATWRSQLAQLDVRRRESAGQTELIRQRITQLDAQIKGSDAQLKGLTTQLASMREELTSLAPLLERGVVTRTRIMQLERSVAGLEGQIGETSASIARVQQAIGEQRQLEIQTKNQRSVSVAQELRDVQTKLAEMVPKLTSAQAIYARTSVRAPYRGRVVGLNVFAVGAVIGRGEKLMDIVPENEQLIAEARIAVEDVGEVMPGSLAEVRITGYKQQTTPTLSAVVQSVSADRLSDERTGAPYYVASVLIDEADLASSPGIKLYPGMPATVMVATSARTALQYLTGPLFAAMGTSFKGR